MRYRKKLQNVKKLVSGFVNKKNTLYFIRNHSPSWIGIENLIKTKGIEIIVYTFGYIYKKKQIMSGV